MHAPSPRRSVRSGVVGSGKAKSLGGPTRPRDGDYVVDLFGDGTNMGKHTHDPARPCHLDLPRFDGLLVLGVDGV